MMDALNSILSKMCEGTARLLNQPVKQPGAWLQAYFRSIYALAVLANPYLVFDVGTERGISALALAFALRTLGRPLSSLITMDIYHDLWNQLPIAHADLLERHNIDLGEVRAITGEFSDYNPGELLGWGTVFIFYDIHDYFQDTEWIPSYSFLTDWLPNITQGVVLVDNMYQCSPLDNGLEEKMSRLYHPSTRKHWLGQTYYGFNECGVIIDWLNQHRGQLFSIPEANQAYFYIKEGKPL